MNEVNVFNTLSQNEIIKELGMVSITTLGWHTGGIEVPLKPVKW